MAKRKRSNGEGCFYQLKDRSWVHQITLGRKEDGTLERKSFKGKTKQICIERKEEWLAEREAQKQQEELQGSEELYRDQQRLKLGHSLESEELFAEAFMGWLRLYKSPPARKPSTYASYIDTYNLHFAPEFGEMPLYMITQDVVQDYYQRKQLNGARSDGKEGGLSPKTIRNHHMILKDFFAYAEKKYKRLSDAAARLQVMQLSQYNAVGDAEAPCEKMMDSVAEHLRGSYDYIIIDCGLKHELLTVNALAAADYCIIPVQAHFLASEGIPDVLKLVQSVQARFNPRLKIAGILLTMYQSRPQLCQSVRYSVSEIYGDSIHVFERPIEQTIKIAECPAVGKSILEYAPKNPAAESYLSLAREVLQLG